MEMVSPSMSPLATYQAHLKRGELAYQFSPSSGRTVFPPRIACPITGARDLVWRVSAGAGTVYATTTVHPRSGPPYNVALIDCDEGFRLMSRVEGLDPAAVSIGMRAQLRVLDPGGGEAPYPAFAPVDGQ